MQAHKQADATPATAITGEPSVGEEALAPPLPNPKHEAFAQAISFGEDSLEACQRIFRCKAATAQAKSTSLLQDPAVATRIATLQREASHIAKHQAHFDKAQLIAFLVETIQTPVSSVDQHHRQCQEWTRDELSTTGRRTRSTSEQKTQTASSKASTKTKSTSKTKDAPPSADTASRAGESTTDTETNTALDSTIPILIRSKTKLPSKLDAAKLLATLCGWHAPSRVDSKVNLGISPTVEDALSRLLK